MFINNHQITPTKTDGTITALCQGQDAVDGGGDDRPRRGKTSVGGLVYLDTDVVVAVGFGSDGAFGADRPSPVGGTIPGDE